MHSIAKNGRDGKFGINAKGRFGKQDFIYVAEDDVYLCPAGERLDELIARHLGR